ncbi:uncharacterized protein LOC144095678 [Amblyomma americanum]
MSRLRCLAPCKRCAAHQPAARRLLCIVHVGGNDISRPNTSPQEICDNIKALVLQLLRDVATVVLVVKVLPRWFITTDAEVSRSWLNRRHLLNRKLTATLKRMPSVFILNPDR